MSGLVNYKERPGWPLFIFSYTLNNVILVISCQPHLQQKLMTTMFVAQERKVKERKANLLTKGGAIVEGK